uniref:muramidase family protein n=1 Tax=Halalkalibacter akibai TaxID=1411 RepID=UPI000B1E4D74
MEILKHSLKEINQATGEFALEVHINDIDFEFANELGTPPESNKFIFLAQKIIRENYPSIKITAINVVFGGLLLTSMSIHSSTASAQSDSVQTAQSQSIYYQVSAGDTLWTISRAFNISIDSIRLANKLTSDVLQPNQRLIIPRAFHTVVTGDSLSVLARNYNTTVSAIREANGLTSDTVRIGQTLVIPIFTVAATTQPSAPLSSSEPSFKIQPINEFYTVVSGDSLSVIAARFNTTVAALRTANGLTNDTLKIGQRLVIPHSTTTAKTDSYTVVSGDSLSVIASRFGVSVNDLRSVNNLRSDVLQIGQVLTIPGATSSPSTSTEQRTQSYTVVSGDSISVIASRFGVSVNDLRSVNNLRS